MMRKKKIPSPITKGAVKVPVVMQLEALECGAASLAMVMAYYGKWVPLEQVRADCGVSRDGSKASNVYKAAIAYGFDAKAFRLTPEGLRTKGRFPCILHWGFNHFVVLNGFKGKYAHINDPARGFVKVGPEELDREFTGVVLEITPGENFVPSGKPKSTLTFARKRLAGAGAAVAFVMLTTAIGYLFGIINSVTSRIFMDRLLTGQNPEWLYPFISVMTLLAIIQIAVAWAQAVYSLKINGKMAAIGSTSYMWKVLRLPMEFFSQRLAGDIQGRLTLNASIAGTLVNTFAPVLLNTVMMVFYLVLMLEQSLWLTLIGLAALVINMVMARIVSNKRVNIIRVQMRDAGKLQATAASGIAMIETIKSSGSENGFFQKWAGYQASVNTQNVKAKRTETLLGKIPAFFSSLANYTVLVLGVYLTMQGSYTLGGVMMFQGFLSSFMSPAMTLISAGQAIQEMRAQMERVEDVMEYPEDEALREHETEVTELSKLKGNLELKNITFGYSRLEKPLIEDFSLSLKTGQRVALVGASGSGKSTISKLISGLYQPWGGEILFDGKPRSAYPRDVMVGSIAVVDQDITKTSLGVEASMMMRLLSLPASFFRKYSPGELHNRSSSVNTLCSTLMDMVLNTGLTSLTSLLYVGQVFRFAPTLVVPSLMIILVMVVFSVLSTLVQIRLNRARMELTAKESGMTYGLLGGVQKIKLAGAEKRVFAKWLNLYAEGAEITYNPPTFIKVNAVISTAIGLFSNTVLYYLAVQSNIGLSSYFAFTAAYGMLIGAFMSVSSIALSAAQIQPFLEMAEPFLKAEPETTQGKEIVTRLSGGIELNHVSFRYSEDGPYILNDLSLKIRPGEYVAVVGRTGCGKSTLVRLLLGFEQPEKGAIYYDGKDMNSLDLPFLRRKIGTVMQDAGLFQGDIYSNIVITAPQLTLDEAWEAAETAGIAEDIRAMPMGMNTLISEGQGGISGGQKQRIMIARAIAPKPKLLIFDEATSALDNKTQKQVSEALDSMGCTRLVIAHRLSTIRHCDRILVLDGGRIIEDGTYDALIEKGGSFAELVERQRMDTAG